MNAHNIYALLITGVTLLFFIYLGVSAKKKIADPIGYFLAGRSVNRQQLGFTMAAANSSNATVALAFMQFVPFFGVWLIVALVTSILG